MEEVEFKTRTGRACISGFTDTHTREMLKDYIKPEKMQGRSYETRYHQMIGMFWKCGIYTYLGNSKRDLKPEEICPKLAILHTYYVDRKFDKNDYARFIKVVVHNSHSSKYPRDKKQKKYISWNTLTWINSTIKKYKE